MTQNDLIEHYSNMLKKQKPRYTHAVLQPELSITHTTVREGNKKLHYVCRAK